MRAALNLILFVLCLAGACLGFASDPPELSPQPYAGG